ncbi:MAG: hypothetical protein KDB65_06095 [Calditrichaeota bacterium]|nr:hypothetical protein [Calditrichota bacterium]MCB9367790.1 hypothetical protein [Calditrichota bacterium]
MAADLVVVLAVLEVVFAEVFLAALFFAAAFLVGAADFFEAVLERVVFFVVFLGISVRKQKLQAYA